MEVFGKARDGESIMEKSPIESFNGAKSNTSNVCVDYDIISSQVLGGDRWTLVGFWAWKSWWVQVLQLLPSLGTSNLESIGKGPLWPHFLEQGLDLWIPQFEHAKGCGRGKQLFTHSQRMELEQQAGGDTSIQALWETLTRTL
ncbi:hypothetical protein HPP92_018219 [Vanilla planifolia]|uniref:Uncharacterized protein n=1 Tax=Vanilla planifolia TaxID=51239 RepID=A0A835Q9E5_VANPL|nr:hypothetical protein HPP92_018219 [Vanilla planifolia]